MSTRARKERKKAGIAFEREPKRPTTRYRTKQERQAERRRQRERDERHAARMAKLAAVVNRKDRADEDA